jgi:hypothetical protein
VQVVKDYFIHYQVQIQDMQVVLEVVVVGTHPDT